MKTLWILSVVVVLTASAAFAAYAMDLHRMALWQVVRACVADYKLTGAPFPCLEVNLAGGEGRGPRRPASAVVERHGPGPDAADHWNRGPVPAVARSAELFRRRLARARVPQRCGRTGPRARRDRAFRELRNCEDSGPAPHPRGLPLSIRAPYARGCGAEGPDGRMGADRAGRPPYDVLGLSHPGNGPCERQSVSTRGRGARRQDEQPGRPDGRGRGGSRRQRR